MSETNARLKEIQAELDVLMDEVHRLRTNIARESRRRTYPFPFDRGGADDKRDHHPSTNEPKR